LAFATAGFEERDGRQVRRFLAAEFATNDALVQYRMIFRNSQMPAKPSKTLPAHTVQGGRAPVLA
jgi:hypothetical protein